MPKYKIGEELNTDACGICVVIDIYESIHFKGNFAYLIGQGDSKFIYLEEDLT